MARCEASMMDINLHIERLVLDGLDLSTGQSELLQATVTHELTQLFNHGGLEPRLVNGATLNKVTTRNIQLNDSNAQSIGQKIAQSVYGGIGSE